MAVASVPVPCRGRRNLAGDPACAGYRPDREIPAAAGRFTRIAAVLSAGLAGTRDRALLLLGFAGALRRSELVGLNVEDLDFREEGLVITVRRSKTDQEGEGREIGNPMPGKPVADRRINIYIDGYNFYVPLSTMDEKHYELCWCDFLALGTHIA